MVEDRWLEPRTRIPLAGIVAIVLVVAVVAVFLKSQLGAFFPETTISVTEGTPADANIAGQASASSSFDGLRQVPLERKERLHGILQQSSGARTYTVDVPERLLTISQGSSQEEVVLTVGTGGILTGVFESAGKATRVDIDPLDRELVVQSPGVSANPITVPLTETLAYEGYFTYRNERLLLQYVPSGPSVRISGASIDTVPLTISDGILVGTWTRDTVEHPVTVDTSRSLATISAVW